MIRFRSVCFLALLMLALQARGFCQDTTSVGKGTQYYSFGFQVSFVSGTGITFGHTEKNFRIRGTIGYLKLESETDYSYGGDFQYVLASHTGFQVLLGPAFGVYGSSSDDSKGRIGLATTLELPSLGTGFYENICSGITLYYPAYYLSSNTVNPSVGAYIVYNF